MSVICGFNMFDQLDLEKPIDEKLGACGYKSFFFAEGVEVFDFSWSGILFRQGEEVKFKGCVDERGPQLIVLNVPVNERISQGRCREDSLLFLCESGNCYRYIYATDSYNQLKFREAPTDEGLDVGIHSLDSSDNVTLLLSRDGCVYSYPSLVTLGSSNVKQVVCGVEHSAFLTESGLVFTWGSSSHGQLGHGDIEDKDEPEELKALSGLNIVSIAAGGWHTCALTATGDLYVWGWNHHKQLGISTESEVVSDPTLVTLPDEDMHIKLVGCGTLHTAVVADDGKVYAWGCNIWCQLGSPGDNITPLPKVIYRPASDIVISKIVASHWNTAFITQSKPLPAD